METSDLIGWLLFGGFCVGAIVVVILIRSSHRKLGRILQRERTLSPVEQGSAPWNRLVQALSAVKGEAGPGGELLSVHRARDSETYLFTHVQVIRHGPHEGGTYKKRSRDSDVCLHLGATGLPNAFTITPKPTGLTGRMVSWLGEAGMMPMSEVSEGLSEEFREAFAVRTRGTDAPRVPRALQEVFVEHHRGQAGAFARLPILKEGGSFSFWSDGFALDTGQNRRLKSAGQVRALLDFVDAIRDVLPAPTRRGP